MNKRPSLSTSSIASNTASRWECVAVTLLSTYNGPRGELKKTFLLRHHISFHSSPLIPCGVVSVLVGNVFVSPLTAPAWPNPSCSHQNKALRIISLGQLILPGSTRRCRLLRQRQPKANELCAIYSQLNQLRLMRVSLFGGELLDASRYEGYPRGQVRHRDHVRGVLRRSETDTLSPGSSMLLAHPQGSGANASVGLLGAKTAPGEQTKPNGCIMFLVSVSCLGQTFYCQTHHVLVHCFTSLMFSCFAQSN